MTQDPACPKCGQRLNRAKLFTEDGTPKKKMLWCSNLECEAFGVMVPEQQET